MSEYYLAEIHARERAKQRDQKDESTAATQSQKLKATLLGDFAIPSGEPQGFDPYNSVHGTHPRDTWHGTRDRR